MLRVLDYPGLSASLTIRYLVAALHGLPIKLTLIPVPYWWLEKITPHGPPYTWPRKACAPKAQTQCEPTYEAEQITVDFLFYLNRQTNVSLLREAPIETQYNSAGRRYPFRPRITFDSERSRFRAHFSLLEADVAENLELIVSLMHNLTGYYLA